ncbi:MULTISPECIES: hypothetical protein [Providencia]|uniref:YejG-like protein n=2 Tax=Providencia TaxID=586 RepID=A0A1B8SQT9_PRORE|nr:MULTISPECIES: hypothetical protein [Providencia]MRF65707.1 hypothetical protein [Escherichia coli]AWS51973.1 hypothetical protein AM461_14685 [Providencia rettgeri]EFE53816.1 hypothetical protein PROVRETT_07468 [Providencia rettgeri DSM 1131]EHZ6874312.1 hypothetical protein [Providencia rettgeri]EHZ7766114.1 hypothetical protein [Providencia rettgeri]
MEKLGLSVVHRLPQSYRWLSGKIGTDVEVVPMNDADSDKLVGLKLLSHDCATDCIAMQQLSESLSDMQIANAILEWQKEICLFIHANDELAAMCRLKASGVAIAELSSGFYSA